VDSTSLGPTGDIEAGTATLLAGKGIREQDFSLELGLCWLPLSRLDSDWCVAWVCCQWCEPQTARVPLATLLCCCRASESTTPAGARVEES
jgi:hypothetical protein